MGHNNPYSLRDLSCQVHSIDGLDHPNPGVGIVPFFMEGLPDDLTLVDTCLASNLPKLRIHIANSGYDMKDIQGIVLAHGFLTIFKPLAIIFKKCIPG